MFVIFLDGIEEQQVRQENHQGGRIKVALPGLPPGWHDLQVRSGEDSASLSVFSTGAVASIKQIMSQWFTSYRGAGQAGSGGPLKSTPSTRASGCWNVSETAVLVMDMWSYHACSPAMMRVDAMVPRMNDVLVAVRDAGVQIIHAPSLGGPEYDGMPQRKRMQDAPTTPPPPGLDFRLSKWETVNEVSSHPEGAVPIVGPPAPSCDDIDPVEPEWDPDRGYSQHAGLQIYPFDGISDEPQEIFNFLSAEGIRNVLVMGVHTNECVLKRAYGIRALLQLGFRVALVRDLTDAMYDSRNPPYTSHARGTHLMVRHIERYLCPSVHSSDLGDPEQLPPHTCRHRD